MQQQYLKVGGIVLAWLAIVFGLIALILHVQPPVGIFVGTLLTVILGGLVALVVILRAVTIPKPAPLPAHIRVQTTRRDQALRPIRYWAAGFAAVAAIAFLLPGVAKPMLLSFDGAFLLMVGLLILANYLGARTADRALTQLATDAAIRWQFSPELWQAWIEAECAAVAAAPPVFLWRRDWLAPVLSIAITFLLLLLYPMAMWTRLLLALGMAGFLLAMVALGQRTRRLAPERRRRELSAAPAEASFGAEGYACAGVFTPWMIADCFLVSASVTPAAGGSLHMIFRRQQSSRRYAPSDTAQTVPIPPKGRADLPAIAAFMHRAAPEAAIALTD